MAKIYINQKEVVPNDNRSNAIEFILKIIVSSITLMLASALFKNFYVENIWYAILASLVISVLNVSIKPLLVYLSLPVTIMSLGILYPIVNVIILKLTSLILGSSFVLNGWFMAFFISIFISYETGALETGVLKAYKEGR